MKKSRNTKNSLIRLCEFVPVAGTTPVVDDESFEVTADVSSQNWRPSDLIARAS